MPIPPLRRIRTKSSGRPLSIFLYVMAPIFQILELICCVPQRMKNIYEKHGANGVWFAMKCPNRWSQGMDAAPCGTPDDPPPPAAALTAPSKDDEKKACQEKQTATGWIIFPGNPYHPCTSHMLESILWQISAYIANWSQTSCERTALQVQSSCETLKFEDFRDYASSRFAVTISRAQQLALQHACAPVPLPSQQLELANAKKEKTSRS